MEVAFRRGISTGKTYVLVTDEPCQLGHIMRLTKNKKLSRFEMKPVSEHFCREYTRTIPKDEEAELFAKLQKALPKVKLTKRRKIVWVKKRD